MTRHEIKRTCPVCHGTGRPTGDKSFGESISGYCYKCHGSGEVTEYVDISSSSSGSLSGGSNGSGIGFLFGALLLFSLAFCIILVIVVIRALYKMLSVKEGFKNFLMLAVLIGNGYLLYWIWIVTFTPMKVGWDIQSPWQYCIIFITVIPIVLFIWGEKKFKLFDRAWITISNFFRFLFEGISAFWQVIVGRV